MFDKKEEKSYNRIVDNKGECHMEKETETKKKTTKKKKEPVEKAPEVKEEKTEEIKEEKAEEVVAEPPKEEAPVVETPPKKKGNAGVVIAILISVIVTFLLLGGIVVLFISGFSAKKVRPETKKETVEKPVQSSPYRLSGNGLEDFDLYFLQLENNQTNKIYSPLSIKYALAMLNEGTDGRSHEQIKALIGDYKAKKYNNNEHMSFANAMFIRNTFKDNIKNSYIQTLEDEFGAEVIVDSFENAKPMNDWISNRTFNLINNLLDDDTVSEENFILINALAIDMNWNNQIQCKEGRTIPCKRYYVKYQHEKYQDIVREIYGEFEKVNFNGQDVDAGTIGVSANRYDIIKELGEENIRKEVGAELQAYIDNGGEMCDKSFDEVMDNYMKELGSNYKRLDASTDFYFYTDNEIKVFAKDLKTYDDMTLQYVAVMPKEDSLQEYIEDVDSDELNEIIRDLKPIELESFKDGVVTKLHGSIPFFKYEYELDLIKDLKTLGVEDIFDINKSDMSKMLTNGKQYIDDAHHKAMIEFSNDGIKAAAVTTMGGAGSSSCFISFDHEYEVPVEEIDVTFDKPYLYIIRDKKSGEVWFAGTVYNPGNN